MNSHTVKIADNFIVGQDQPLFLIAGPCVIESADLVLKTAERVKEIASHLGINFIFKSSFDKANRSSINSFRGPGFDEGLQILADVKKNLDLPVLTDIHSADQASAVAEVADVLQIPAFLCRQTDLLVAAAKTGRIVNVKKGQFLSPWDVENIVLKVTDNGGRGVMLTERGASFGYRHLIVDMKSIPVMQETGWPVVFDATHSVQLPGGKGHASDGLRQYVPTLAKAAVAAGADGLFLEVHPDPDSGLSDGPNMWPLDKLELLLEQLMKIAELVR